MSFPTCALLLDTGDPTVASPTWTDITAFVAVDGISCRRGRNFELDSIEAGTSAIALENLDRRFDPTYTAGALYPNVKPMRRIRLQATFNSITYNVFTHYVERWPPSWEGPDWAQVDLTATDGFVILQNAALVLTRSAEASGARIGAVLDSIGWPAAARSIDTGKSTVTACAFVDTDDEVALSHIQDVAKAEDGLFFIDGSGNAVFQDRSHRQLATTSQVTLTDDITAVTTNVLAYEDTVPSYDIDHIWNEVKGKSVSGTLQSAVDSPSQVTYFRRSLVEQGLLVSSDAEVLNRAQYRLSRFKSPSLRIDSVSLFPAVSDTVAAFYWPHLLGREVSDRVTFQRLPPTHPAGSVETVKIDCFIEAIEHTIDPPNAWHTKYLLSPADTQTYWLLGDAVAGLLGSTTTLGY